MEIKLISLIKKGKKYKFALPITSVWQYGGFSAESKIFGVFEVQ